ncbi:undecaprenyl/decaprenyl-phosphate alpha-N-acetylglucosaminyl 1-phosphate transferase [Candidatus Sumerlaeota bacterium]|nr:undecaprenyl/decaprenyl-phosphate alpha-N-acetylglucosaminyl 1-phosphate transferase [Candidatus Sumerlaeota bacterium]
MDMFKISSLVTMGVGAAVASFGLTFLVRGFSSTLGIFDIPDERKIHTHKVPCIGGLSIFIISVLVLSLFVRLYPSGFIFRQQILGLILGSTIITILGVWDDVRGSGAGLKLSIQGLVGILMYWTGFRFEQISLPLAGTVKLGILGLVLTIIWFCLIINAINLIDGLDGLAAGLSLIAATTILVVSYPTTQPLSVILAIIIIGSCAGFLPHNFYPAKIFLGDTGSMLLGFWLAGLSLLTSTKAPALLILLIPVIAMGLPVFDTLHAFIRRVRHRQHPFRADQRHIHHRLLHLGYSHRHSVIILYIASIYLGLTAYILAQAETFVTLLTLLLLVLGCILIVQILRQRPDLNHRVR